MHVLLSVVSGSCVFVYILYYYMTRSSRLVVIFFLYSQLKYSVIYTVHLSRIWDNYFFSFFLLFTILF